MTHPRPTLDDLREEEHPGTLAREALERAAPTMLAALRFVADWMDGKRTPSGRRAPRGMREVRDVVAAAIEASSQETEATVS